MESSSARRILHSHEALGIRPTDQSCHHKAWLHLDFVEYRNEQPHREKHDRRILLKERSAPYHYGKQKGQHTTWRVRTRGHRIAGICRYKARGGEAHTMVVTPKTISSSSWTTSLRWPWPLCGEGHSLESHVSHHTSHTRLTHVSHTSLTRLTHVSHTSHTRLTHVSHTSHTRLSHVSHTSHTRLSHVSHTSHTRLTCSVQGWRWMDQPRQ